MVGGKSVGFSETLSRETQALLTCCDLTARCPEEVMDAKGKRNSKNTGKGPLDTAIRSFVPQAVKELLRVPPRCAVLYWQLELCHLPKFEGPIIGCLSWVLKLSLGNLLVFFFICTQRARTE